MRTHDVVLVGVDGSEVANAALRFAADEARLRSAQLLIAHAGPANSGDPAGQVQPLGEIVCREAVATVAEVHPELDSHVITGTGDAGVLLTELSARADLLVVGTHRTGRLRGWVLGSVSQYVAAHASCPVVTITDAPGHGAGVIVLGASSSPGGLAAMRFACEEAQRRGAPVHAIRSVINEDWALTGPAFALGVDVVRDTARAELDKVLAAAGEEFPDVPATGELSEGDPFHDLLHASGSAGMLVVGSRRSDDAALPHLGPLAAWLLHQATCPLAVVGRPRPA